VPWIAVVHGHDFDVALKDHRAKRIEKIARSADRLVVVSNSLSRFDSITIPCHVNVDKEWHKPMKESKNAFENRKSIFYSPHTTAVQKKITYSP
jgi:hypothetical protein